MPDPVSGKDYFYVRLNDVTTEITGDDPDAPLSFAPQTVAGDQTQPENRTALASMHWVPHLKEVWPTVLGNVHASHPDLESELPEGTVVRGRYSLSNGQIEVTRVNDAIFLFKPRVTGNPEVRQTLAQEVTQTVTLVDSELYFVTKNLHTGKPIGEYKVGLKAGSTRTELKILLANVPLVDLLPGPRTCVNPSMKCEDPNDPDPCTCVDEHFHHYYGVFKNPPGLADQPVPYRIGKRTNKAVTTHRVGGGNCGPTQYP
jgi:hypothetical protein